MNVRVKLFAVARELTGCEELVLEVPEGSTVADLQRIAEKQRPTLAKILPHAMWAVDAEYANDNTTINANNEIALIPPVSGG